MAKNRKTVWKRFTYLQCDDFADYLSSMALRGWHFREWNTGLVFEKGEPEEAVYAVEVFIHGTDYDLKPDNQTLNFADYCEKAGWKLIDAKQKFCIFKQITPHAPPIMTPEERFENASKAYKRSFTWQIVLAVIWLFNLGLRFIPPWSFVENIFSNFQLILAAYWIFYAIYTIGKGFWFHSWKRNAKKRCQKGETHFLNQADETTGNALLLCNLFLFTIGATITMGPSSLALTFIIILAIFILAFLLSKFRPDRDTNIVLQVIFSILLIMGITVGSIAWVVATSEQASNQDAFPLLYTDLNYDAGTPIDCNHIGESSIFGSNDYYIVYYYDATLCYELYTSNHGWLLDLVLEDHMRYERNQTITDCTELWDAEMAFTNTDGEYYVRYDNALLIFRNYDHLDLTAEQIQAIRDTMGLEG